MGLTYYSDGTASFRVWAPHAAAASLLVDVARKAPSAALPRADSSAVGLDPVAADVPDPQALEDALASVQGTALPLSRIEGDTWAATLPAGALPPGAAYQLVFGTHDGRALHRRDPWARQTDYDSNWCYAVDPAVYQWRYRSWTPPSHDRYIIYEMQVGALGLKKRKERT